MERPLPRPGAPLLAGDAHALGAFATALAGSSDVFPPPVTRTVNFIAAHDGFTLADLVAHREKHNMANGEGNRDGHGENLSWNNGAEGATDDPAVLAARGRDLRALLATLFASRGTIMLTAGDEFGRSQNGNNNAYAQDNPTTWLDWEGRDRALEDHCAHLAALRRAIPALSDPRLLTGEGAEPDVAWLTPQGAPMTPADWESPEAGALAMVLARPGEGRIAVLFNRTHHALAFRLPPAHGRSWLAAPDGRVEVGPRSVAFVAESREADAAGRFPALEPEARTP
jgi:glycogen operon protein